MLKHRHAYYEACNIMITQSVHQAQFSKVFNINQIIKEPESPELEVDSQRSRQKITKDSGKSDASDEDLPEDIVESANKPSNSPVVKMDAPRIDLTPALEKALTPQNFSQAIHPTLQTQLVTPATPNHIPQQPLNSTLSEVSSNLAQYQSVVHPIGQKQFVQVQHQTPASHRSYHSNPSGTQVQQFPAHY